MGGRGWLDESVDRRMRERGWVNGMSEWERGRGGEVVVVVVVVVVVAVVVVVVGGGDNGWDIPPPSSRTLARP